MAIPVHVIGGFLGAGKTTALMGLLDGALGGERVAVVVNDFGEGAIDQATVGERSVSIAEIRGGCVCCTAPEGFVGAVGTLLDDPTVERILVEPTGLARPSDLIDTLRRAPYAPRIDVRPLVVLVDPMVLAGPHRAQLEEQAAVADYLVASRVDLATDDALAAFDAWAEKLWPGPLRALRSSAGAVDPVVLDWPAGTGPRTLITGASTVRHLHDHDLRHVHGHVVKTFTWPPETVFGRARLLEAIEHIRNDESVTRLKGLFRTDEGWTRLEIAGGQGHEGPTAWRRDSRIDAIIDAGATYSEVVYQALVEAILTDEEKASAAESVEVGLPDGSARRFDRAALQALPGGVADVSPLLPGRIGAAARVSALLDSVGAADGLQAVVVAADGYVTPPVPAEALAAGLLLHSVDGGPLPAGHGGPLRLMIPGDAGPGGPCANVKAVVRIALREP